MKDIYKGVRTLSAAALTTVGALGMNACAVQRQPEYNPWMTKPQPAETVFVDGTRQMTVHSPGRDRHGAEVVVDRCVDGQYERYDPEITWRDEHDSQFTAIAPVLSTNRVETESKQSAIAAAQACADGRLEPGDPLPPLLYLAR
jgi:hypothetical protein